MNEEHQSPRRPLGERGSDESQRPFGDEPRRRHAPDVEEEITATTPYPPHETAPPEWDEVDSEPPLPDPPFEDEPLDAPALIKARDRRGKVPTGRTILKERPFEPEIESESYATPSVDELDAQGGEAVEAVARRPTVMIRFGVLLRSLGVMFASAAVVATLFTWWTPNSFMTARSIDQLSVALATQSRQEPPAQLLPPAATATEEPEAAAAEPTLNNIGIVSGHRGTNPASGIPDPGAVCPDGLTEAEINEAVATRLVDLLQEYGYQVDLLDEFDSRLTDYEALALISIHADTCEYINEYATGFKVASFAETGNPEADNQLVSCLIDRYSDTTGLSFHPSVTYDMTQYHTFHEIALGTPGVIIETGFMNLDRELLTEHQDTVALGIARGILCFLRGEGSDADSTATPTAPPEP